MSRESFVFYKSFYEAMQNIPEENRLELYEAICQYCFYDEIIELDGISKAMFILMKPNIDKANARYFASVANGKKGGRPSKNKTQDKPNQNLDETQDKPNQNLNEDDNEDEDVDGKEDIHSASDNAQKKNSHPKKKVDELFEQLWKLYPYKKGKGQISDAKKNKLYDIGYEEMERAINRYIAGLEKDDWRKPQNGSTFFNSGYIDYLDANYVQPPQNTKPQNKSRYSNYQNSTSKEVADEFENLFLQEANKQQRSGS